MPKQLTTHFTMEDMCQTSRADFYQDNLKYGNSEFEKTKDLAKFAEEAYTILDGIVLSGAIRCPLLNQAVGGVPTSQHCTIDAIDFRPKDKKMSLEDAVAILRIKLKDWGQLIIERIGGKAWIHLSRPRTNGKPNRQVMSYDGKRFTNI